MSSTSNNVNRPLTPDEEESVRLLEQGWPQSSTVVGANGQQLDVSGNGVAEIRDQVGSLNIPGVNGEQTPKGGGPGQNYKPTFEEFNPENRAWEPVE